MRTHLILIFTVLGLRTRHRKYCVITLRYAFPQRHSRVGHSPLYTIINSWCESKGDIQPPNQNTRVTIASVALGMMSTLCEYTSQANQNNYHLFHM